MFLSSAILILMPLATEAAALHPENKAVDHDEKPRSQAEFAQRRQKTLDWIDRFAYEQAFFNKDDVKAIRAKVSNMTPQRLDAWLDQTLEIRQILESERWRQINTWLKDYMSERFDSTPGRIEEFQENAAQKSAPELLELIHRIQREYEAAMSEIADRRAEIEALHRMARNNAWGRSQQGLIAVTRRSGRQQGPSHVPHYPRTHGAPNRHRHLMRRYNLPLITSREVAGLAVRRAVFGRRGYRW